MRRRRTRVVLDTNVLVSGVFFEDGNEFEVLKSASKGDIDVFISPDIFAEFVEVIRRPKFQLARDEVSAACEFILSLAKFTIPLRSVKAQVRDPDDLKLLECAKQARANYIVTGDYDLLILRRFHKTRIISPSMFARQLKTARRST